MARTTKPTYNIQPKKTAVAMQSAFPAKPKSYDIGGSPKLEQTWEAINDISNAIGEGIIETAVAMRDSVELVKSLGCQHVTEFNIVVTKANEDLLRFSDDYKLIKAQHADKSGVIASDDEYALSLQIFEKYTQFRAYFDGVMNHTMVSLTEYALEAKDVAMDAARKREAAEAAQNTATAPETEVQLKA